MRMRCIAHAADPLEPSDLLTRIRVHTGRTGAGLEQDFDVSAAHPAAVCGSQSTKIPSLGSAQRPLDRALRLVLTTNHLDRKSVV